MGLVSVREVNSLSSSTVARRSDRVFSAESETSGCPLAQTIEIAGTEGSSRHSHQLWNSSIAEKSARRCRSSKMKTISAGMTPAA